MNLRQRPVEPADTPFLVRLHESTLERELADLALDPAQRTELARQQMELQRAHYRRQYPGTQFLLLLDGDLPVGKLTLHEREQEIGLMDIALLPAWRNRGHGERVTRAVQAAAREAGKSVGLYVEVNNPGARRFYARLGFVTKETLPTHERLVWTPPA